MSHVVGSVSPGLLADLVLWSPADFGVRPKMVVKGGFIAWAQMGDANASIPTVQPIIGRRMYGAEPEAAAMNSVIFTSQIAIDNGGYRAYPENPLTLPGTMRAYDLRKRPVGVHGCRDISKRDMKLNDCMPTMEVDPETYETFADGVLMDIQPAEKVALAMGNFLY